MKMRIAQLNDEAVLLQLWRHFMTELHAGKAPTAAETESWVKRLKPQLSRKQVLVAEDEQGIQGFAGFIDNEDNRVVPTGVAYIVDIYVTPDFRRKAIGVDLLRHVVGHAWQNGFEKVWTNTEEWNQPAQRCLENAGFTVFTGYEFPGLQNQRYYQMRSVS